MNVYSRIQGYDDKYNKLEQNLIIKKNVCVFYRYKRSQCGKGRIS